MHINYLAIFSIFLFSTSALAGSGLMDGDKTMMVETRAHTIECNSHLTPSNAGSERFFCEYKDRMSDNGTSANDSMFAGEIFVRDRGNVVIMVQFGDVTDYVSVFTGQMDANGQISGTALDVDGNEQDFTIN